MSTSTGKEAKDLSYEELKALLDSKKDEAVLLLRKELAVAEESIKTITEKLKEFGEHVGILPKKRGRKPQSSLPMESTKPAKTRGKAKGKRGAVGQAILAYLATKGKAGAKVNDIATAIGNKPANVTSFFYAGAGKKACKRIAPGTFALKK
jgi:cyanate lyase